MKKENLKRKNIDLPEQTLRKLSLMAAIEGCSLKSYIENILKAKANSVDIKITEKPVSES